MHLSNGCPSMADSIRFNIYETEEDKSFNETLEDDYNFAD